MPIGRPGYYTLPHNSGDRVKLDVLLISARHYISKGLAPSTLNAYTSAWSLFTTFFSFQIPLFPIMITTVWSFLTYNYDHRQLKVSSIRRLLAGIQFYAKFFTPDYPSLFTVPSVHLLLKGLAKSSPSQPDKRMPITLSVLHRLIITYQPFLKDRSSHYCSRMWGFDSNHKTAGQMVLFCIRILCETGPQQHPRCSTSSLEWRSRYFHAYTGGGV